MGALKYAFLGSTKQRLYVDVGLSSLALIPATIFFSEIQIHQLIRPYFAGLGGYDYDPSYVYLLNGLSILHGYVPNHVDHPGTPLQLLTGLLSLLYWLCQRMFGAENRDFAMAVLAAPEDYLGFISGVLLGLNSLAIAYLGLAVRIASGKLALALVAQSGVLLFGSMSPRFGYVAPEALEIFAALMFLGELSGCLFGTMYVRGTAGSQPSPLRIGFYAALGVTAKITFLPLLPLILLLGSPRNIVQTILSVAGFIAVILVPVWPKLPVIFGWIVQIASHDGLYGRGELGAVKWDEIPARLSTLMAVTPQGFIAIGACASVIWRELATRIDPRSSPSTLMTACLFLGVGVLQVVFTLKHFGIHYFVPFVTISSIILAWVADKMVDGVKVSQYRNFVFATAALSIIIFGSVKIQRIIEIYQPMTAARGARLEAIRRVIANYSAPIVIGAYRVSDANYALQFALGYVDPRFATELMSNHSGWSYNRWNFRFLESGVSWRTSCDVQRGLISRYDVIFILPSDVAIPGLDAETLFSTGQGDRILRVKKLEGDCS